MLSEHRLLLRGDRKTPATLENGLRQQGRDFLVLTRTAVFHLGSAIYACGVTGRAVGEHLMRVGRVTVIAFEVAAGAATCPCEVSKCVFGRII